MGKRKVLDNCNRRSHIVQDLHGNTYRRNSKFITKTTMHFETNNSASEFDFIVYDTLLVSTTVEIENPNEEIKKNLNISH